MKRAYEIIKGVLANAEHPCVAWSGGKDSQLLLAIIREYVPDIDVLWYRDEIRPFQARFIMDNDLTVYSYPHSDQYYLPNDEGLSLVREYSIGGVPFPVIQDVHYSDQCGLDLPKTFPPSLNFPWSDVFTGWKATDTHFITGTNPFPEDGAQIGFSKFHAPLRSYDDQEVLDECERRGIKFDPDNGEVGYCTRCFSTEGAQVHCPKLNTMIPTQQWDRELSTRSFRERFLAAI